MKYLDYPRARNAEPALRTLLMSLVRQDTIRRVQAQFPEFFTDERPQSGPVAYQDIVTRALSLRADEDFLELDGLPDEFYKALFDWFGLQKYDFERRIDREQQKGYILVQPDFDVLRTNDYDGFTDEPWIASLPTSNDIAKRMDYWILDVLGMEDIACDEETTHFFTAIPITLIEM